jgi:hypothetical protein
MFLFFSAFIEKNTWAGLEDFYGSLCRSLLIVSTEMSRGLKIKKIKKRSRQVNDVTQFETQKSFVDVINDAELKPITSGLTIKRGRPSGKNTSDIKNLNFEISK